MAQRTDCQTPGAQFHIHVKATSVEVHVDLLRELGLDEAGARLLEKNLHNAVELVLARYFVTQPRPARVS